MAYAMGNDTQMGHILELLIDNGFEGMAGAMETLMNSAMILERQQHLGVGYDQRGEARQGQRMGLSPRWLKPDYRSKQVKI